MKFELSKREDLNQIRRMLCSKVRNLGNKILHYWKVRPRVDLEQSSNKTLMETFFALFGGKYILASLVVAFIPFVIGIMISFLIGFTHDYLTTPPIYLGVIGIAWVSFWIGWGMRQIRVLFRSIRPALLVSDDAFNKELCRWLRWIFHAPSQVLVSSVLVIVGCGIVYINTFYWKPPWLNEVWFSEPFLPEKFIILCLYVIPIAFLLIVSGSGIIFYISSVSAVSRLQLIPNVSVARVLLKPLASFSLRLGVAWSGGVLLFVLLFRQSLFLQPDLLTIVGVVSLTLLGLTFIVLPEYVLYKALEDLQHTALSKAANHIRTICCNKLESPWDVVLDETNIHKYISLWMVLQSTTETQTWFYNYRIILTNTVLALIPAVPILSDLLYN